MASDAQLVLSSKQSSKPLRRPFDKYHYYDYLEDNQPQSSYSRPANETEFLAEQEAQIRKKQAFKYAEWLPEYTQSKQDDPACRQSADQPHAVHSDVRPVDHTPVLDRDQVVAPPTILYPPVYQPRPATFPISAAGT